MRRIYLGGMILLIGLLAGCSTMGSNGHSSGRMEISRQEAVTNPNMRPGSTLLLVQPYRSTWAIVRVYKKNLSRADAIGNVNGQLAFYSDYVDKIKLTNAFQYNMSNLKDVYSRPNLNSVQNTAALLLDPDTIYTVVVYVGWGRSVFERMYTVDVDYIHTSNNPIESGWTDSWNRQWMANRVLVLPGTNEPSMSSLNLVYRINATEIVRNAVGAALWR